MQGSVIDKEGPCVGNIIAVGPTCGQRPLFLKRSISKVLITPTKNGSPIICVGVYAARK